MIRRKMWATMTCCLALAGAGRSQTDAPVKASLGKPQTGPGAPGYVARGAAPGYPAGYPVPATTYSAPTPPTGGVPGYAPAYVPPAGAPQYAPAYGPPTGAPQYAPAGAAPQYVPATTQQYVPQYGAPNLRPAGFASMQAPTAVPVQTLAAPMQMPMNSAPMQPGMAPAITSSPAYAGSPGTMSGPVMMGSPVESGQVTTVPSYSVPGPGGYSYGQQPSGDCANGNCATPMYGSIPGVMDCAPNCCPLPCVWIAPEYINWRTKGANIPPLVTTAPRGSLGTLGLPDTRVAFGGSDMQDTWRSGFRVRGGFFLDKCEGLGLDFGYFMLAQGRDRFNANSNGDPGFFRPFRTPGGAEDAQLVAFIDNTLGPVLSGRIAINSTTDLTGGEANLRKVWCCDSNGRTDVIFGFRYMRLRDSLSIFEDLTASSNDPNAAAPFGTRIQVFDKFETTNDFYGGQIGLAGERRYGNFILGYRGTVALGITHQKTTIAGATTTLTPDGTSSSSQGGLLALPTNIGTYNSDRFSVIPEAQLTLGYQVTKNLKIFGGYNFMYWSNVLRAGEQVDRTVNASFIPNPGADAGTGALRPAYNRHDTGFWAHGWTAGLEFRW